MTLAAAQSIRMYSTDKISISSRPSGVFKTTSSPSLALIKQRANGEIQEILFCAVSISSTPTILTVCSRPSPRNNPTVAPKNTWSVASRNSGSTTTAASKTLGQETDAAVDFAHTAFAVKIVAVFAAVAVACRPVDDLDDFGTLFIDQLIQFVFQRLPTDGRDVVFGFGTHNLAVKNNIVD